MLIDSTGIGSFSTRRRIESWVFRPCVRDDYGRAKRFERLFKRHGFPRVTLSIHCSSALATARAERSVPCRATTNCPSISLLWKLKRPNHWESPALSSLACPNPKTLKGPEPTMTTASSSGRSVPLSRKLTTYLSSPTLAFANTPVTDTAVMLSMEMSTTTRPLICSPKRRCHRPEPGLM